MTQRKMEFVWAAIALGLALFVWKKPGASSPPASQLYHPTLNPYGYVYVKGQWIANDPGTSGAYYYDAGLGDKISQTPGGAT